jgi:glutamate racemase
MGKEVDVLVFDSGVGGLSVLQAIRSELPHLSFAFVADNAGLPYGKKEASWLVERVNAVIATALEQTPARLVVIACNTASTVVLPSLRMRHAMPIVGVVPAIKPAAELSTKRCIGLLATPATVQRTYTDSLIQEFAPDCKVVRVGSSRLVEIAEDKMRGIPVPLEEFRAICADFQNAEPTPDVIVLGCTHFPLLLKECKDLMPDVIWLDSGHAIARRVGALLPETTAHEGGRSETAFFTQLAPDNEALKRSLLAFELKDLQALVLPSGTILP